MLIALKRTVTALEKQIGELQGELEELTRALEDKGGDAKDLAIVRLKAQKSAAETRIRDATARRSEALARSGVSAILVIGSGLFFSWVVRELLRSSLVTDETLATLFGISAVWAVLLIAFVRSFHLKR